MWDRMDRQLIAMPVVYEGFEFFIGQPIVAALLSCIAIPVFVLIGSPLYLPAVTRGWYRLWWISPLLGSLGFVLQVMSWLPQFTEQVYDMESKRMIESFNPILSVDGYSLVMFSIVHCPLISARSIGAGWRRGGRLFNEYFSLSNSRPDA
jgi:hypothetical protein